VTINVTLDNIGSSVLAADAPAQSSSEAVTVDTSVTNVTMVTVDAGMSRFSGVVQADTVICNSIISASYTPGAGNIW